MIGLRDFLGTCIIAVLIGGPFAVYFYNMV